MRTTLCLRALFVLTVLLMSCGNIPLSGNNGLADWFPFSDDFTSPSIRWHKEVAGDTAISSDVSNVAGNATAKEKVVVTPQDVSNHGNRAELAIYNCGQYLDTVYYGFDFLVPLGDPDDFDWQVLAQWYQLPDFDHGETFDLQYPQPPEKLVLRPGRLTLNTTIPEEKEIDSVAIGKDTWYRVVVKVHFDVDGDGELDMWFGSPGLLSAVSPGSNRLITLRNRAGIYFKMGLYRGYEGQTQAKSTNSVYLDNFKIGRSLAEVQ